VESERMLMRKIWDHAIDLKETFKPQKGRIYVMDMGWDYQYYQPWSDNEWLF